MKKISLSALCFALVLTAFTCLVGAADVSESLGTVRLNVETYLAGKNQPTHPSAMVFSQPWNGYKYWMAYSPYPYGSGEEENPCIAVSNDMLYWETPVGLANPIADNEETGCDELKDPHIVYREDLDRLEMWYLGRLSPSLGGDGTSLLLFRKCSSDGITWSDYEVMMETEYLSPTIIWNQGRYQMWSIGYDLWGTEGTIVYQESQDGVQWTEPVNCSIGGQSAGADIWHGAVSFYDGAYHFVFIDNTDRQEIYYCSSEDGLCFDAPVTIVENQGHWKFLYRPALLFEGEQVFCLYGVVNGANQWYISMSAGQHVQALKGITQLDVGNMYPLNDEVIDTHGPVYLLRTLYHAVQDYLRIELFALAAVELTGMIFWKKLRRSKIFLLGCFLTNLILSVLWIFVRQHPASLLLCAAAIVAIAVLNISMAAILYGYQSLTKKV